MLLEGLRWEHSKVPGNAVNALLVHPKLHLHRQRVLRHIFCGEGVKGCNKAQRIRYKFFACIRRI